MSHQGGLSGWDGNRKAWSSRANKRKQSHLQPVGNRGRASRTDVVVVQNQIPQSGVLLLNEHNATSESVFKRGHRGGVVWGWEKD